MSDEPTPRAIRTSRGAPTRDEPMLVLTGMSGAGRSTMANVLEDLGWYVVDNLPPQMLPQLLRAPRGVPRPDPGADDPPRRRRRRRPQPRGVRRLRPDRRRARPRRTPPVGRLPRRHRRGPGPPVRERPPPAPAPGVRPAARRHPAGAGAARRAALRGRRHPRHLRPQRAPAGRQGDVPLRRRRGRPAAPGRHVVRVQVRRPARRGLRPRPPFPAEPVLGPGAAAPHRPRRAGGRVRPVPAGGQGVRRRRRATSWTRSSRASSARAVATSRSPLGCTGGKHRSVAIAEQLAERLRTDTVDTFLVHRDLGRE